MERDQSMTDKQKLEDDERNRISRHEDVKDVVRREAQTEISARASAPMNETEEAAKVGRQLRQNAVAEVATTESELSRARKVARVSQFIDYFFYLVYGIVSLEILLELMGARRNNGFRGFIDALSSPLLSPFQGLTPELGLGRFHLRFSYFVALIVYILLHLAVNGFLKLLAHRKTTI